MNTTLTPPAPAPPAVAPGPWLVTLAELAKLCGVSLSTAERMRAAGRLPAPRKFGRLVRWSADELREWLARPNPDGSLMTEAQWAAARKAILRGRPSRN